MLQAKLVERGNSDFYFANFLCASDFIAATAGKSELLMEKAVLINFDLCE